MTNYANGDTGSDRAYDYEREVREAAIDAQNEWIRENGPFETEDEADAAYADAKREWEEETYREEQRYEAMAMWSDVEQGRYDDDPNPYHGDYSEM
jgi:hypothetical protein